MKTLDLPIGFPRAANPNQSRLLASAAREVLAMGVPGSGKSEAAYFKILAAACAYPGNMCAIGRAQLKDVTEHTLPHFFRIAPKELFTNWVPREKFMNRSPMVLRTHHGSEIQFVGFHESADAGSANWGAVLLQEVYSPLGGRGINHETYLGIDKALRCPAAPFRFIIADTNQAPPDHWLHDEFGDNGRPGHEVVLFDWASNRANLPEAHVAAMEAEWLANPMLKRLLENPGWCEVISGKPVYGDVFRPDIHIAKGTPGEPEEEILPADPTKPISRNWDPSFVQPWVTFSQVVDGQWRTLGEWLPKQVFLPELIRGVELYGAEHFPGCTFEDVADHAVHQRKDTGKPIDTMRQHGIYPRTTPTQSVRDGIEVIVDYLTRLLPGGRATFQIHPRCEATIQCLQHGYCWKKGRDDRLRDEPSKDGFYDNGADALRYDAVNNLGGVHRREIMDPMAGVMATYGEMARGPAPVLVGNQWLTPM